MSKHLAIATRARGPARPAGRGKGWPPERRARQAARARLTEPWRRSTGPRTEAGKARVAMNALRHGGRSRAWQLKAQRIRRAIRLCAQTVLLARVLLRERDRPVSLASQFTACGSANSRPHLSLVAGESHVAPRAQLQIPPPPCGEVDPAVAA